MKVAVITPYYWKEPLARIRRCHESVLGQTHPCTHFIVGDGVAFPEIDTWQCEHVKLSKDHDDYGNTPRSIGAMSALNLGYDVVAFLNADDWYHPSHVQSALKAREEHNYDVVFTSRHIVFPDGSVLPFEDDEDRTGKHVDSSCFVIFKSAAFLLPFWAMMPRSGAAIGDRILLAFVKGKKDIRFGWTGQQTVYFETNYPHHFRLAHKPLPTSPRDINVENIQAQWSIDECYQRLRAKVELQ
jgi:hypothetical protein